MMTTVTTTTRVRCASSTTTTTTGRRSNAAKVTTRTTVRRSGERRRASSVTTHAGTGKFIVGGNWKCNGTAASVETLVKELNSGKIDADLDIYVAPPFVFIPRVQAALNDKYSVAAQNCWVSSGGAYTGEVSADMLVDAGIPWVILGHSERRALCGETNEFVGEKTKYALSKGLKVALCIGETLEQRESGTTMDVCFAQLKAVNDVITPADWENIVIAYEPVWAIGTGKVATPDQAQEVHAGIRKWCATNISADVASKIRIQYGGSVNAGNCEELAQKEDIDGFLVGGASLIGDAFVTICNSAKHSS